MTSEWIIRFDEGLKTPCIAYSSTADSLSRKYANMTLYGWLLLPGSPYAKAYYDLDRVQERKLKHRKTNGL